MEQADPRPSRRMSHDHPPRRGARAPGETSRCAPAVDISRARSSQNNVKGRIYRWNKKGPIKTNRTACVLLVIVYWFHKCRSRRRYGSSKKEIHE